MKRKTILEINSYDNGSTGTIMRKIAEIARENGHICYTSSVIRKKNNLEVGNQYHIYFNSLVMKTIHKVMGRLTGLTGCFSVLDTFFFLWKIDRIHPDIIHIHNLIDSWLCLPLLFSFIKRRDVLLVWTLHSCWEFTGRCPHFEISKCERWKTDCSDCAYPLNEFPQVFINQAKRMRKWKEKWFGGINHAIVITPSAWLQRMARESFLNQYPIRVIYNGIDRSVFKPMSSSFRFENGISENECMLLGVASPWSEKKGIDVFRRLAKRLDRKYKIVLVGVAKEDVQNLPESIIAIERLDHPSELAKIYSAADILVNPTREEVLSLVNLEALACGTPVITFNSGGSPECIDETCGYVVEKDNINELQERIVYTCENRPFSENACIKRAERFDSEKQYGEYVKLYEEEL